MMMIRNKLFILLAIALTQILEASSALAEKKKEKDWAICTYFKSEIKPGNKGIKESAVIKKITSILPPGRSQIDADLAKKIYLRAHPNVDVNEKKSGDFFDAINKNKVAVFEVNVDMNNNGDLERVIEYLSPAPFTRSFNYVVDVNNELDRRFSSGGFSFGETPALIFGQLVIFNGKTYLAHLENATNTGDSKIYERIFSIYKLGTSPLQNNSGIFVDYRDVLCELSVITDGVQGGL